MVEGGRSASNQDDGAGGNRHDRSVYDDYRDKLGHGGISNRYGRDTVTADVGGRLARSGGKGGVTWQKYT